MENNLENMNNVRDTISQSLGINLTEDNVAKIMRGESLSLDQLIDQLLEHHTLTEIGVALIRLESLSNMSPSQEEELIVQKKTLITKRERCIVILGIKICAEWGLYPNPTS